MAFDGGGNVKRVIVVLFLLLVAIPNVSAASVIKGWVPVPSDISVGEDNILLKDISPRDGSLLVSFNDKMSIVALKSSEKLDGYTLYMDNVLLDERGYANLSLSFPYLMEGESLAFGGYRITLNSVSESQANVLISYKNVSKSFTYKGGNINFESLSISLTPMPLLLDGYLYKGVPKSIYAWNITFKDYSVSSEENNLNELVKIEINGEDYWVKVGETLETDDLKISVDDLLGSNYLKLKVRLKGAYINAKISPAFYGDMVEGKTTKIGPYLVSIDKIFSDSAYVTIKNPCGMPLKSGLISVAHMISYGGLHLGALGIQEKNNEKSIKAIIFLEKDKIPKIEDTAFLNVSFKTPEGALQYGAFKARVVLENKGSVDLRYIEINPKISGDFKIAGDYPKYISLLKSGQKFEFLITLIPENAGNLTIGNIEVIAHAPYQLSCYGFGEISFSSEVRSIYVNRAKPEYKVEINGTGGKIGEALPLNITIVNKGNTYGPYELTLAVPKSMGVIAENFTLYGKWLYLRGKLEPGSEIIYPLTLVPSKEGTYEVSAVVKEGDELFQNSTILNVTAISPTIIEKNGSTVVQNTSTVTETIEKTVTVPKIVVQNNTIEVIPLKKKLIFGGGGFLAGVIFILGLAFVAAKLEERKGK